MDLEDLKKETTFSIGICIEVENRMSDSGSSKLNKIARDGLKSRNLHGGRKCNFEQFSCWQLLLNLHGF
jgi:hypothetical protein